MLYHLDRKLNRDLEMWRDKFHAMLRPGAPWRPIVLLATKADLPGSVFSREEIEQLALDKRLSAGFLVSAQRDWCAFVQIVSLRALNSLREHQMFLIFVIYFFIYLFVWFGLVWFCFTSGIVKGRFFQCFA